MSGVVDFVHPWVLLLLPLALLPLALRAPAEVTLPMGAPLPATDHEVGY